MNAELKAKMQQVAEKISSLQSDGIFKQLIEVVFMRGATDMYAELSSLVEWVSVDDRLPYSDGYYLTKNEKEISLLFFHSFLQKFSKHATHWRRIEL